MRLWIHQTEEGVRAGEQRKESEREGRKRGGGSDRNVEKDGRMERKRGGREGERYVEWVEGGGGAGR